MTLETVYVFVKSCAATVPPGIKPMFTRMKQDMSVVSHPGIPTIPWEDVFPQELRPSLLVLVDFMRETVDSDKVMDLIS